MERRLASWESGLLRWHKWHITLIAASVCVACGGQTIAGDAMGGGASTGGGAPTGSGASTGSGGGNAIGGGGSGGGGYPGGGSACKVTHDALTIEIDGFDGETLTCTSTPPNAVFQGQVWKTVGIVTKSAPDYIDVNSCAPDAHCTPLLSTIHVDAPGLALSIPVGSIVSVDYVGPNANERQYSCSGQILIQSVGDWGGVHDPAGDGKLYLAGMDGMLSAPAGAPFKVSFGQLPCSTYGGNYQAGQALPGEYALRFSGPGQADTVVDMGDTAAFVLDNKKLRVRNLRSFQPDAPDTYWNWAYWVAP